MHRPTSKPSRYDTIDSILLQAPIQPASDANRSDSKHQTLQKFRTFFNQTEQSQLISVIVSQSQLAMLQTPQHRENSEQSQQVQRVSSQQAARQVRLTPIQEEKSQMSYSPLQPQNLRFHTANTDKSGIQRYQSPNSFQLLKQSSHSLYSLSWLNICGLFLVFFSLLYLGLHKSHLHVQDNSGYLSNLVVERDQLRNKSDNLQFENNQLSVQLRELEVEKKYQKQELQVMLKAKERVERENEELKTQLEMITKETLKRLQY